MEKLPGVLQVKYERFLDLWKDAGPDMPEVEDAKKRLTGLKNLTPPLIP
jgi:hypothetical protein